MDASLSDIKFHLLFLMVLLTACTPGQEVDVYFSEIVPVQKHEFAPDFKAYNAYLSSGDYEKLAVLSNFYGDYQSAVQFATKRAETSSAKNGGIMTSAENKEALKVGLQEALKHIKDPVFGNMVREALNIGYQLIAYEVDDTKLEHTNYNNTFNMLLKIIRLKAR